MDFKCNTCNKNYSSYQSLWIHNKKFHNNISSNLHSITHNNTNNIVELPQNNIEKNKFTCKFCNKILSRTDAVKRHENICKQKKILEEKKNKELEIEKLKLAQIEKETIKIQEEKELIKLKLKIKNDKKLNSISFSTLNKMLKNNNYTNNSHNNNNNTTNIQNNNNIQLISFGKDEHLIDYLTNKEQKSIILSGNKCIEKLIDITYNGPSYNQFKNIIITNLKDNFIYKYDKKKGYFVAANKNDTLKEFIDTRVLDIEEIYNKLSDAKKIDENTKNTIEKFLYKIQNYNEKFVDNNDNITYPSYRDYKINKIKILLYNNHDKVSKDLALYFMPEENIEI